MEGKKCANSLLQCPAEAKTALERIVQVINNGGAESVVGDITLRTTATRPADQSPYEVSLVASAEGQMFRSSLQAITQPDSPGENTRDRPEKCWEVSALQTSSWGAGEGTMSSARPDCAQRRAVCSPVIAAANAPAQLGSAGFLLRGELL